jgi:hypothetical protein
MHIHIKKSPQVSGTGFVITLYEKPEGFGFLLLAPKYKIALSEVREMIITVLVEKLSHEDEDIAVDAACLGFGPGISIIEVQGSKYSIEDVYSHIALWTNAQYIPGVPVDLPKKPVHHHTKRNCK